MNLKDEALKGITIANKDIKRCQLLIDKEVDRLFAIGETFVNQLNSEVGENVWELETKSTVPEYECYYVTTNGKIWHFFNDKVSLKIICKPLLNNKNQYSVELMFGTKTKDHRYGSMRWHEPLSGNISFFLSCRDGLFYGNNLKSINEVNPKIKNHLLEYFTRHNSYNPCKNR